MRVSMGIVGHCLLASVLIAGTAAAADSILGFVSAVGIYDNGPLTVAGTTRQGGSLYLPTVTKAASFTFDATMRNVPASAASGAIVGTLPPCTAATKGLIYGLQKIDGSSNAVSYAAAGSDLIAGAATLAITTQYAVATVQCSDTPGRWDKGF